MPVAGLDVDVKGEDQVATIKELGAVFKGKQPEAHLPDAVVDFVRPIERDGTFVNTLDLALDITISPDMSWRWKDEAHLPIMRELGWLDAETEEAMEHALQYGRGLDTELADRFVGMYVNELTCDYGEEGRQAVRELLSRAEKLGAYEQPVKVEFVG